VKEDLMAGAIASLLIVISVAIAHEVGWSRATKSATAAATAREDRLRSDHATALGQANQRERDAEHRAGTDLAAQATVYKLEIKNERKKRDRLAADLRTGAVRLSIPVIAGSAHCAAAESPDSSTGRRDRHETRAELGAQTGLDLVAIAQDGDDAIRQLNVCIETYNTVRAHFNALDNAKTR
jgi:hypothetical protein